ncbi:glycoside hydrolase family 3 protein [Nocardiopsis sp. HUAS JQ3]|uniref:glycoside hydrolase family 3 protein n=1 Tax=Nocardiopsis sp. HUAS JQ3 TaxID=3061629 RepID=UPI0023A96C51|nr:glycoside hydrolase family 3 protein [Nocardiopsis sp. HUAS JQ3]WDZ91406.1 glycoside hydrolase family 3 C-terminal domain-containing protein [Nocardiopsis sp. HUAS JQ3]
MTLQPHLPPYRDPALPAERRVDDLLARLTPEERIGLLHQHQAPVERLGVGPFRTGTEALHGLAWLGPATVYPQAVGLASTWDPGLLRLVGRAVGDEVLARRGAGASPNVWAPVVNPLRDPRWGRNEEGYSEDAWLTGLLAAAYARGLAGDGDTLRLAPTLKHFLAYNNEEGRCETSSDLPPRVLHEYELQAFLPALAEGAAVSVMPSYNLVNGRPAHLSPLIGDVLRPTAPDRLLVVSDAYAPANLVEAQHFHPDLPTAYAHAIRAGLDSFTQDDDRAGATLGHVREALRRGLLTGADIDRAARNVLSVRIRLGEFDPVMGGVDGLAGVGGDLLAGDGPDGEVWDVGTGDTGVGDAVGKRGYGDTGEGGDGTGAAGTAGTPGEPGGGTAGGAGDSVGAAGAFDTPEHRALAREAATRSIVLLRDEGALLPLRDVRRVAVVGQLGDTVLEDWYSGTLPYAVTARAGIAERVETVFCEGVDRIRLGAAGGATVADPGDGGPLRTVLPDEHGALRGADGTLRRRAPEAERARTEGARTEGAPVGGADFDLLDWGGGACALRSVRTGRYVDAGADGVLACTAPGPGTWEVTQTFRLAEEDGLLRLTHVHSGRGVTVRDGLLVLAEDGDRAAPFTVDGLGTGAEEAARTASAADVAVVVLGDHPMVNGRETEDRTDLDLPAAQERVLRAVRAANPATVLVLSSGCPFGITWADEHVPAVLWSAHGGQEYGHGLADVLFGDAEPSGRLPQTWYRSADDLPGMLDYDIVGARGTYLYFEGEPLYPFGHGLGYTSVEYADPVVRVDGGRVTVTVVVANTGTRPADELVQVYSRQLASRVRTPLRALRGFARVRVEPGRSAMAAVSFDVDRLALWDTTRDRFVVEEAPRQVLVGRSATDIRAIAALDVPGEAVPPRDARTPWSAAGYDDARGTSLCPLTPERGDAVRSREGGAWAAFHGVDLGDGATGCRLTVNAEHACTVRIRLDDPEDGPTAAVADVPAGKDGYDFTEVGAAFGDAGGAGGIRDLYLVFDRPGTAVADLVLTGGAPEPEAD